MHIYELSYSIKYQFSVGFLGFRRSKCSLRVLLRFVVWGFKKLFLGVLTKIKFFFVQITHNGEHIKNSKNLIFDGAE